MQQAERHMLLHEPNNLRFFLRHALPIDRGGECTNRRVVLYIHGATFPSALSIAFPFDGFSWMDMLTQAGYDVWALDFLGFGESDRYPEMQNSLPGHASALPGRASEAWLQIAQAVNYIVQQQNVHSLSIVAHSWGTMPACLFAIHYPELVKRLVLFAPTTVRKQTTTINDRLPAYRVVSLAAQWQRFTEDVPATEPPVLLQRHFEEWGPAYLATDPTSQTREPASVAIPNGPGADIVEARQGKLAYDPAEIKVPVAIIRGEWDSLCTDSGACGLFNALTHSPLKRDIKIGHATHLMHLEEGRFALYQETLGFFEGNDTAVSVSLLSAGKAESH